MNLTSQKQIASRIMKVGMNRVRINPENLEKVAEAITRDDIRSLIKNGAIYALPKRGLSKGRIKRIKAAKEKGRRKGHGGRTGRKMARTPRKKAWESRIRAIRDELKKLKKEKKISGKIYRKLYRRASGGFFHSRRHLREYIERM